MNSFGSFWSGTLSPYETYCLESFVKRGHKMVLYSYEPMGNLPKGVVQGNAADIVEQTYLKRFITDKKVNIAAFSDYFRYTMFTKTDLCWVDSDIFALQDFEIEQTSNFFVIEDGGICNAFLRIEPSSPELKIIIDRTLQTLDKDTPWAATQNFIAKTFRKRLEQMGPALKSPAEYMPIHFNDFYKLLLPEYLDECKAICKGAKTVHLYNNILDKMGVYKQLLPPAGSYLHGLFTVDGGGADFIGTYPEKVMKQLIEGWHLRFSGEHIGLGAVIRQAVPSLVRTARRKLA